MSVASAIEATDLMVAKLKGLTAQQGKPVTCGKCFSCCKEPVLVAKIEVTYMLEGLSEVELHALREKTKRWWAIFRASGLMKETKMHVLFYRQAQLWCPFLQDGLCSVYPRRPIACRIHLAVGDPKMCVDDTDRLRQKFVYSPQMQAQGYVELVGVKEHALTEDLLGIWLVNILLDQKVASGYRQIMSSEVEGSTLVLKFE